MDDKTKADYERAAVELGEGSFTGSDLVQFKAWNLAVLEMAGSGKSRTIDEICAEAARLLRECLERNEALK